MNNRFPILISRQCVCNTFCCISSYWIINMLTLFSSCCFVSLSLRKHLFFMQREGATSTHWPMTNSFLWKWFSGRQEPFHTVPIDKLHSKRRNKLPYWLDLHLILLLLCWQLSDLNQTMFLTALMDSLSLFYVWFLVCSSRKSDKLQ